MAKSAAQMRATSKYDKKTYDFIKLTFRKDSELNGTVIRAHAAAQGESVNGFFIRAITEAIKGRGCESSGE